MKPTGNIICDKSLEFAVEIVSVYKYLSENKKEFVMSKQLLRSGTSIGANIREAQNAESKADFIHKLSISQKECDESIYWMILLNETGYLSNDQFKKLETSAISLLRILKSSILTTKQKVNSNMKIK